MLRPVEAVLEQIPYLEKEMLVLHKLISPGDVCFDVGAAGGTYMWLFARFSSPGGRVFSFEPRPRSARAIERFRRLAGMENVSVHQVGFAEQERSVTVLIPTWRGFQFTTRAFIAPEVDAELPEGFTNLLPMIIQLTTLDQFVIDASVERIDFLKADVEGAELSLLEGGKESIERWRPTVLLEIEDRHLGRYGQRASEVVEFMTDRGYRMLTFSNGELRPAGEVVEDENNYLFLPSS
ncbi:MAG: FkbM family methyltransferase [Acidimicrobiia bacterium]